MDIKNGDHACHSNKIIARAEEVIGSRAGAVKSALFATGRPVAATTISVYRNLAKSKKN